LRKNTEWKRFRPDSYGKTAQDLQSGPATLKFLAILNNIRGPEPMVIDCFPEEPWVSHFKPIEYPPV
jgi:hypothetical protein